MDSSNSGGRARDPRARAREPAARGGAKPPRAARDRGSTPSSDRPADRVVEPFSGRVLGVRIAPSRDGSDGEPEARRRHDARRPRAGPADRAPGARARRPRRRRSRAPRARRRASAGRARPRVRSPRPRPPASGARSPRRRTRDRPIRAARLRARRSSASRPSLMRPRPAAPARTPIVRETDAASSSPCVVVRIVCPGARSASSSRARRSRSSSDATSSSSSSGRSPRASVSVSASASTSARSALRCSPCEPKARTSRASANAMSSSCGPGAGERALDVAAAAAAQGLAQPLGVDGAVRPVGEGRRGRAAAERLEARAEGRLEQVDEPGADVGERRAGRRHGVVPGIERTRLRNARAHAAQQVVALRERAREVAARSAGSRPAARGRAVEVGAARRRRALDDREPVGGEDEDREAGRQRIERGRARAVDRHPLRLARPEADGDLGLAPLDDGRDLDARELLALGDEPALVGRARRPAEAAEVHRLEQRRLAGAVRADDRGDAVAELDLEARVAAERGRPEALHAHAAR